MVANAMHDPVRSAHAMVFEDAWRDLASQCHDTIAPEAAYQAWLAHFAIRRLTPVQVVREVDFGARYLGEAAGSPQTARKPHGGSPAVAGTDCEPASPCSTGSSPLPDGTVNPRSGLGRLGDFSVITELKVSATQIEGLDYGEVVRDFRKLSVILAAAERDYPDHRLPAAYVGVFANARRPRFNFDLLRHKLADARLRPEVHMAAFETQSGEVTFESGW